MAGHTGHAFDPTILREYDIRGVVGSTLSTEDAYAIGRAFGTIVVRAGGSSVAIGWDGRHSSPRLADALAEGLAACGLRVFRIGLGPTPMLYFAVHHLGAGGGIQVTGSHNPPNYNGFKMMIGTKPFYGDQIAALGRLAATGDYVSAEGRAESVDLYDTYVARILADFVAGGRDLRVAWDPGNGSAGAVLPALTRGLPGFHVLINAEVDGDFPAHHPDPTVPENLIQLQETVRTEGCDLGIAFDGDGDRIGVVAGDGEILWADQLLILLARAVLAEHPGATIIADVKASRALFDAVAEAGGVPLMWRTGHSLIKSKMAEVGSPLAGEMSGHIFFADRYYGFDDALYVAVRTLSALAHGGQSLAEFRRTLPHLVNTPEMRFPCPEDRKFAVAPEVRARLEAAGAEVNDIDGVRVTTPDGWWLLRPSNTQDVLVARCEAFSDEGLARLKAALAEQLRASGIEPPSDL